MMSAHRSPLVALACALLIPGCGSDDGGPRAVPPDVPIGDLTGTGSVSTADGQEIDLGFGTVTTTRVTLPGGNVNAREVYQVAHYIGRTDGEANEDDIDIPIRSYVAACNTDTGEPRLFVSVSLAESADNGAATFGSVYELGYDPATGAFAPTGNSVVLPECYESHGVAVSPDCSRVGVLCNIGYRASENYAVDGDLVEQYGTTWMRMEDNHEQLDARIEDEIGLLLATNHGRYMGFFTNHPRLTIGDFIPGLQSAFPDAGFDNTTTFDDLRGAGMADAVEHVVGQLSAGDRADLLNHIRVHGYRHNDQIWLLEWDGQPLTETPSAHVVNKMHGGTHLGAQELLYVDADSQGRASYAFSVSARVFDDEGDSHYSAGLTVVNRGDWSLKMSGSDNRGWDWACGDGHVANIRAFYNADTELYGAICTSDWNDWIGNTHGQLGTVAIKMEGSTSITEGRFQHFVPSHSAMVTNGGGHTVVPVDANTNLSVVVSPQFIEDADMDRWLTTELGLDISSGGPFDQDCADWDAINCFLSYMSHEHWEQDGEYLSIPRQGLFGDSALGSASLTRIGIAPVNAESGSMEGSAFRWVAEDADCQLSDPQLVDLHNGRYLLGYGRFQCISDGLGFDRIYATRGAMRMLVPKAYYLMEVDGDGNVLAGPVELPGHGWGGLDEPVSLGVGRVAWTYIQNPTIGAYAGGQQSEWEVLVYESATPAP